MVRVKGEPERSEKERTTSPGQSGRLRRGARSSCFPKAADGQLQGSVPSGCCCRNKNEEDYSKSAPDLHLPTQNYTIHLEAIFKLKCCQRVVTVLIFLFCSFSIHPHFLVGLEKGVRGIEPGLDSEIFGIIKSREFQKLRSFLLGNFSPRTQGHNRSVSIRICRDYKDWVGHPAAILKPPLGVSVCSPAPHLRAVR